MKAKELKSRVLQSIHEVIYRYWVDPLQSRIPDWATVKPDWWRKLLLNGALWGVNVGRLAITDFRVHVRRLRGPCWTAVYIGAGFSFEELCHVLFPTWVDVEELPRVFLWQVPAVARRFASQDELVICELARVIRWRPRGAYVFSVPCWVRQVLDVARPMGDILAGMNQNTRRNLRKMQSQGFDYVFTRDEKDFDLFYYKMHCPYIAQRHGTRAALGGHDYLRRRFRQGGLILVTRDQDPICAMLCRVTGDTCEAGQMGVHEEHLDQVRKGSNVALWWFMLDWARRNDLLYFDFGASRAQTTNGTFNFKRQWGTRVSPERDVQTEWVFYSERLSPALRRHLNEQGFISRVGDAHCRVILLEQSGDLTDAELVHEREQASRWGLDEILCVSPQADSREGTLPCPGGQAEIVRFPATSLRASAQNDGIEFSGER